MAPTAFVSSFTAAPFAASFASSKSAMTPSVQSYKPSVAKTPCTRPATIRAEAVSAADVPDMAKRNTLNLILAGAVALPGSAVLGGYAYFFVPPSSGAGSGGIAAKDALGNDVKSSEWLKTHKNADRSLVQGLKGDATYLVVSDDGTKLEGFGVNAVCTHLGCVVPWNKAANKFMCPCHGSQYDKNGKVVRGPAPLSLALAVVEVQDDNVSLRPWTETDFRTGTNPWWK